MTHYFCEECGEGSENPGVCTTEGCGKKSHPLTECNCEVGLPAHKKSEKMES